MPKNSTEIHVDYLELVDFRSPKKFNKYKTVKWYSEEEILKAIEDIKKFMIELAYQKRGKKLCRVNINHHRIEEFIDK